MFPGHNHIRSADNNRRAEAAEACHAGGYNNAGLADEDPAVSDRLPLKAILHKETFHDYTPEDIDEYYKEKEALPENRHFVEINNKETLAQVFTDCRYTKRDNEAMSAGMIEVLKRQGFLK